MELKFHIWSNINLHFPFSLQAPHFISGIILKDFSQAFLASMLLFVFSLWQLLQNDKAITLPDLSKNSSFTSSVIGTFGSA